MSTIIDKQLIQVTQGDTLNVALTLKLMNASYFYEMDTSISYFFDAENKIWYMKLIN